jgi:hypothetical protein
MTILVLVTRSRLQLCNDCAGELGCDCTLRTWRRHVGLHLHNPCIPGLSRAVLRDEALFCSPTDALQEFRPWNHERAG